MDDLVERVAQSRDSEEMARVLEKAGPAAREGLMDAALGFWRRPGLDRRAASEFLLRMATAFARCQDPPRAARLAALVADSARESGDLEPLGRALGTMGVLLMNSGVTGEARRLFEQVLTLSRETGDARSRARALHNLGILEALEGQEIRAVGSFEEAQALARKSGDGEVARKAGLFLDAASGSPAPEPAGASPGPAPGPAAEPPGPSPGPAPVATPPAPAPLPCPDCQGQGMVHKEDYGFVLCPTCRGAREVPGPQAGMQPTT